VANKPSLGSLVSGVSEDLSSLVRGEIELVKTELRDSARSAGRGSGLIIAALTTAFLAVIFLLLTAAWGLVQAGLPVWAAFGIVTLVLIVITLILGFLGKKHLDEVKGAERSMASIEKSKAVLKRTTPGPV